MVNVQLLIDCAEQGPLADRAITPAMTFPFGIMFNLIATWLSQSVKIVVLI